VRANRMSFRAHPIKGPLFRKDKGPPYIELEYLFINALSIGVIVNESYSNYQISCCANNKVR
jgi:hypothetical protein